MKHYVSTSAVCPFYEQEQPMKIHCEGFSKSNTIQISFKNDERKKLYTSKRCYSLENYKKCPIYQAVEKCYVEDK